MGLPVDIGSPISTNRVVSIVKNPITTPVTLQRKPRTLSRPAPEPSATIRGAQGPVEVTGPERVKPYAAASPQLEPGGGQSATAFAGVKQIFSKTAGTVVSSVADKLNVEPETVKNVGLISLIGTGAGLLANGVKSLFDGTLKEKRAAKKAEKAEAKVEQQAAVLKAAFGSATGGQGIAAAGGANSAATLGGANAGGGMAGAGQFIQKNWMWLALGALLLFGGNILKKNSRPRRRATRTKTITRYRTRRAPARRSPARRRRR